MVARIFFIFNVQFMRLRCSFSADANVHFERRRCSISNDAGVQLKRHIRLSTFFALDSKNGTSNPIMGADVN